MESTSIQLGVLELILQAGLLVKIVLLLLFTSAVSSWAIILLKRRLLIQASQQNEDFLTGFWGGWSVDESFTKAKNFPLSPIAKSFQAAVQELQRVSGKKDQEAKNMRAALVVRALKKSNGAELSALEYSLSWLATTASTAPFVGLFGTVWGIMSSFQTIGSTGNANLAAVAPGISEALIATAVGLAAAIPAAIAYNFLIGKVRSHATELDAFSQDLLNLFEREGVI